MGFVSYFRDQPGNRRSRAFLGASLAGLLCFSGSARAAQISACDMNGDGVVNVVDVNLSVSMALGATPCGGWVEGPLTCTIVTVQRVVNAALGQSCVVYNAGTHSVTLNWVASTGAVSYNVYRGTTSGGPYTKVNSTAITVLTYTDGSVLNGQTYYYVLTSVDASGNESGFSNQATANVPPF